MKMRKSYGKEYLQELFAKIGDSLSEEMTVFLFGGGAMAFRNQKPATKDVDLILDKERDYAVFTELIKHLGFKEPVEVEIEHKGIKAIDGMWDNPNGFRLDLFVKHVLHKLELTEQVKKRSELLASYGLLEVRMLSNEDVILFKCMTDRIDDLGDIAAIVRTSSIDWNIILEECKLQERSKKGGLLLRLLEKLEELKEKQGIDAPILPQLRKIASQ
ncbi:hypothetical protein HY991_03980 [Candidatus Micrarchaeota archaeon]|nr:hypothetical protein [Candidatus Micrarchaeota archaeon]